MTDPTCAICGCDMAGEEVYDDTCDECAKKEGLLDEPYEHRRPLEDHVDKEGDE